ncbi:sugar phosphate isomerase/epimerase family protein [Actinophytocola algeriensis]|uniref:Sugar phosphate isomerase/epimerase n=1 Tax=Actinophytocola algeriensis TaxID=1768010 RepID=A0A7W7VBC5_9PSEU|nr:sugar phosphate isomerase/epimerase [Actinophytocola algeriensis]MBB4903811.1 sugar phosphate isomerase/epimerase [Actinophytocola algeriensis]MBE1477332.1 sugar phosphate isomerase/epimerase [Actinophytocola algeriensis]
MLRGAAGAALAVGAAGVLPGVASAERGGHGGHWGLRVPKDKISIQLYTLRSILENDLEGTLDALADIGYRKVELAGTYGRSAEEFRKLLDARRIKATSTHVGIDGDIDQAIADAKVLGNRRSNVAWANFGTIAEWETFADRLEAAGKAYRRAGIGFGYHNHDHEFQAIDGVRPYDVLTRRTSRRNVSLEMDLYWVVVAGADPVREFYKIAGRVKQYHVKDRAPDGGFADLGEGNIDFRRIFRATRPLEVEEYIVENDQPVDALKCAETGYNYLANLRF